MVRFAASVRRCNSLFHSKPIFDMNRIIGLALVLIGIILFYYGWQEGESLAGEIEEAVTGSPSDRSLGLIIGGILSFAIGAGLVLYPGKRGD